MSDFTTQGIGDVVSRVSREKVSGLQLIEAAKILIKTILINPEILWLFIFLVLYSSSLHYQISEFHFLNGIYC